MPETREEQADRIRSVAALLGISPEQLVIAASNAQGTIEALEPEEPEVKPPPIVYPNLRFPKYKFREYPKLLYRGYIRDVEEPIVKFLDGKQINAVRILPDQFVMETMEIKNKIEEMTRPAGWYLTLAEAKEAAVKAKANTRPIVERILPSDGAPPEPVEEEPERAPRRRAPRRRR